jgi:putative component of toxin-antitoxin plasmid stabilization module
MCNLQFTMMEIRQTTVFREWLDGLADRSATARIAQRIVRLQAGLIGDAKPVGGGDKRSQRRDIARAKALAVELEVE